MHIDTTYLHKEIDNSSKEVEILKALLEYLKDKNYNKISFLVKVYFWKVSDLKNKSLKLKQHDKELDKGSDVGMAIHQIECYDNTEHLENRNKGTHHDGTKVATETSSNEPTMMEIKGLE